MVQIVALNLPGSGEDGLMVVCGFSSDFLRLELIELANEVDGLESTSELISANSLV